MAQHTIMSQSHLGVSLTLMAMGIWHENEAAVEDGQFSVDIKLEGIPEQVHVPSQPLPLCVSLYLRSGSSSLPVCVCVCVHPKAHLDIRTPHE